MIVSKFVRRCFAFSASIGEMHYRCCMQVTSVMTCKALRDVTKINALKSNRVAIRQADRLIVNIDVNRKISISA